MTYYLGDGEVFEPTPTNRALTDSEEMMLSEFWVSKDSEDQLDIYWEHLSDHGRATSCGLCRYYMRGEPVKGHYVPDKKWWTTEENPRGVCFVDPKPQAVDLIRPACSRFAEDHSNREIYPALYKNQNLKQKSVADMHEDFKTLDIRADLQEQVYKYVRSLEREMDYDPEWAEFQEWKKQKSRDADCLADESATPDTENDR